MLPPSIREIVLSVRQAVQRHPKRMAAGLTAVLSGFAVTAVAIAPMAPDAANLPKRVLTEPLALEDLPAQLEALAGQEIDLHRSTVTRGSDTADTLLKRLGVSDPVAASFLRQDADARRLISGDDGKMVQARTAADGTLLEVVARFPALDSTQSDSHFSRLTIARVGGQLASKLETAPLQREVRLGSGKVQDTLWGATDKARLPDAVAAQMLEIFSADIDFHRELRRGDSFSVVFEALTADGEPITWNEGTGRVLAAEFINRKRKLEALWFSDPDTGKGGYFTLDGKSRHKSFLASPLQFSRITSGFAMRMHPVMQTWRAHKGVDYAAPAGTPVKTVADGTVKFAGRQSGYGNVVEVAHASQKATLYAHLSRIDVKVGQRVEQGQVLGAVGATGWATGPHLHFEFSINGQVRDPLEVARNTENLTIDAAQRPHFLQTAGTARHRLAAAESIGRFRGDAE